MGPEGVEFGKHLGARSRETIAWRLHPDYTQHLAESDLRRFDWTKAQQLRGVAMALWMVFSSERVPYRRVFDATDVDVGVIGLHRAEFGTDVDRAIPRQGRRRYNRCGGCQR